MEDPEVERRMQDSELPRLPWYFKGESSFFAVTWKLYQSKLRSIQTGLQKFSVRDILEDPNPLISAYTWLVMVPVGGSFCSKF